MANIQNTVLGTVAANSADISVSGGQVTMAGITNIPFEASKFIAVVTPSAGTAGVASIAYSFANSTNYTFTMQQYIPSFGTWLTRTFNYTSPSSGTTDAGMATLIKNWITNNGFYTTNAGAASPVTATASASYPLLVAYSGNNVTVTMTTPAAPAVGNYDDLVNNFGVPAASVVSGNYYDRYQINTPVLSGNGNGNSTNTMTVTRYIFVNRGTSASAASTNSDKLRVGYSNVCQGWTVNSGTAVSYVSVTGAADITALKAALGTTMGQNQFNQTAATIA